ncbi:alpha/beta fold hydrolase [Ureibacillus thermosphaericus]|uniref:alpha/beta fold hydrolase n=1 Tax=Ureibacillus thermosphaericus TaxID=51173 RepID=UPI00031A45B5|nr:alpha/beta fold hydrolase [Ureibacillus thermosphaericus]
MEFHEFGNLRNPKLLLIHGMAVTWESFNQLIDELSKHYYLIIPSLDGHNGDSSSHFECIDQETEQIENYILSRYTDYVHGAYGFSMGGTILLKLLANQKIQISKVILDAAYYLPLGIYSKTAAMILSKILLDLRNNQLHPKMRSLLSYYDVDVESLKKALYPQISLKSIENCFLELFKFSLQQSLRNSTEMYYWYGSNEIIPAKSIKYLKQVIPNIKEKVLKDLGHGEFITKYSTEAVKEMRTIYG